ncbi:MAG: LysR family transcriptional regulator [Thermoplasmata archaeon]|nr:LysR family transcriptional regulator [Thermoplasmata archaeon]
MEIEPQLDLLIGSVRITKHQLDILLKIHETRSQTQAAHQLGISVPVLHRYIKNLETKLGYSLLITTPNGSRLTTKAKKIVREYRRYQKILERPSFPIVGCTLVTQDLVLKAVSELEWQGYNFDVIISDDIQNRKLATLGHLDLVLFDDPQNVYEFEDKGEHFDIFEDTLVHIPRGKRYLKFRYGAQRIGFKYLDLKGIDYTIQAQVSDIRELLDSDLSFFINKSLAARANFQLEVSEDIAKFKHMIMALMLSERAEILKLVETLRN